MPGFVKLPPAGAAALVAVVLGIGLGTSTIEAVNPAFYRGPAIHPRDRGAALDPREIEAARLARQASLAEWPLGGAPMRIACLGCAGRPANVRVYSGAVPYFGSVEEADARDAREQAEIDRRFDAEMEAQDARTAREEDLLRYEGVGGPLEQAIDEPPPEDDVADDSAAEPPDDEAAVLRDVHETNPRLAHS